MAMWNQKLLRELKRSFCMFSDYRLRDYFSQTYKLVVTYWHSHLMLWNQEHNTYTKLHELITRTIFFEHRPHVSEIETVSRYKKFCPHGDLRSENTKMKSNPYIPSMVQAITVLTVLKMMTKGKFTSSTKSDN